MHEPHRLRVVSKGKQIAMIACVDGAYRQSLRAQNRNAESDSFNHLQVPKGDQHRRGP